MYIAKKGLFVIFMFPLPLQNIRILNILTFIFIFNFGGKENRTFL